VADGFAGIHKGDNKKPSMNVTKTLLVTTRKQWRSWLKKHHASSPEIWLVFYLKDSGKQGLGYNDAVEEAMCFGWIDSTVKKLDKVRKVQRFSPRKPGSSLSEMNKERVRRLIKAGLMTFAGLESIKRYVRHDADGKIEIEPFTMPRDIIAALKRDKTIWNNFAAFPEYYKNIRVGFIEGARKRPLEFKKRLGYFIKMTAINKRFGMIQ
jgi:uncharacterized protein YdeI (YjbR/CyaY-like superfamily)